MDNNFESIKKFVACKSCQYYKKGKCMNKGDCFWLDLEKKLKTLEIIKECFYINGFDEFVPNTEWYDEKNEYKRKLIYEVFDND